MLYRCSIHPGHENGGRMAVLDPAWYLAPLVIFGLGTVAALLDRKAPGRLSHLAALLASLLGVVVGAQALLVGATVHLADFAVTPFARFSLRLDPLAAFFLFVISLIAVATSLYAL